jgi:alkanesulfonate monooxygenase SsuD/methylene tetrahydromethanopterin reductase-like flavin-dependent oxidoreductase (luciferase family)
MVQLGYKLSSEEFGPRELVDNARKAEEAGPKAAEMAGRLGEGLVATSPDAETMKAFERAGGRRKPRYGELTVCWAESEAKAKRARSSRKWRGRPQGRPPRAPSPLSTGASSRPAHSVHEPS